jgi:hypothetical protein
MVASYYVLIDISGSEAEAKFDLIFRAIAEAFFPCPWRLEGSGCFVTWVSGQWQASPLRENFIQRIDQKSPENASLVAGINVLFDSVRANRSAQNRQMPHALIFTDREVADPSWRIPAMGFNRQLAGRVLAIGLGPGISRSSLLLLTDNVGILASDDDISVVSSILNELDSDWIEAPIATGDRLLCLILETSCTFRPAEIELAFASFRRAAAQRPGADSICVISFSSASSLLIPPTTTEAGLAALQAIPIPAPEGVPAVGQALRFAARVAFEHVYASSWAPKATLPDIHFIASGDSTDEWQTPSLELQQCANVYTIPHPASNHLGRLRLIGERLIDWHLYCRGDGAPGPLRDGSLR